MVTGNFDKRADSMEGWGDWIFWVNKVVTGYINGDGECRG